MRLIRDSQNDLSKCDALLLGNAVMLMARSKKYLGFHISSIAGWTLPAINVNQIKIFFDEKGRPVGYVTWAFLSDETEKKWMEDANFRLHPSEWNEGLNLWIIDFVSSPGFIWGIISSIKRDLFSENKKIRWIRRDDNGKIIRNCIFERP